MIDNGSKSPSQAAIPHVDFDDAGPAGLYHPTDEVQPHLVVAAPEPVTPEPVVVPQPEPEPVTPVEVAPVSAPAPVYQSDPQLLEILRQQNQTLAALQGEVAVLRNPPKSAPAPEVPPTFETDEQRLFWEVGQLKKQNESIAKQNEDFRNEFQTRIRQSDYQAAGNQHFQTAHETLAAAEKVNEVAKAHPVVAEEIRNDLKAEIKTWLEGAVRTGEIAHYSQPQIQQMVNQRYVALANKYGRLRQEKVVETAEARAANARAAISSPGRGGAVNKSAKPKSGAAGPVDWDREKDEINKDWAALGGR